MVDRRHIENVFYLIPNIAKNGTKKQSQVQTPVTWTKYHISNIHDGGLPPFWKWFYRYISSSDYPISIKFRRHMQILIPTSENDFCNKMQIQHGVKRPIDKIYQYKSNSEIDNIQPTTRIVDFVPVISAVVVTVTELVGINARWTRRFTTALRIHSRAVDVR